MRLGKNLFAPVKFFDIPIGKILCAGSAVTFSKICVAVFASLQIAIRICRTASAMTLQGITPILPMIIFFGGRADVASRFVVVEFSFRRAA
ncbi:MAG: hypothetical protein IKD80_04345 [Selenomonadaceae bacterium]|nr:hypothetical protein [Selenomonadaceae bacterium]